MARALQSFEAHPGVPWEPSGRRRPVVALVHGAEGRRTVTATATFDVVAVGVDRRIVDRLLAIRPDAVLVELDGADVDTVRLCRVLRGALEARIVVMATDRLDDAVVVDVLDAGADDVVIGASPAVIDARVRVALGAQRPAPALPSVLELGDVVVALLAHEVRIGGSAVRCPPVQYELLVAFARRPGVAIGADDL